MATYQFNNLAGRPDQGYLAFLVEREAALNGKMFENPTFHPEEHWMKVDFVSDLTPSEQSAFEALLPTSMIQNKFRLQTGEEYFQHQSGNRRWEVRRARVRFHDKFRSVPTVEIFNAEFDGLANLQVVKVTEGGFNFLVEANGSRRVPGITAMQFEWRAWTA